MRLLKDDRPLGPALEVVAAAPLLTARYAKFHPGQGVAVRTSVGAPRFWRHGPMCHCKELTPYGVFKNPDLDEAGQRLAYLARLNDLAAPAIEFLAETARANPGSPLLVLCFEDLST